MDEEPVAIPRDEILFKILGSSMPVIPLSGDWGQGKSFIGRLLYRHSAINKTFYVTYIPLATTYRQIKQIDQNYSLLASRFYGFNPITKPIEQSVLVAEPMPVDARRALSVILPQLFSPNTIKSLYELDSLLTTYPKDRDLRPQAYGRGLIDIANAVSSVLDKRLVIVLDELEEVSELLTVDKLGAIMYLVRLIYDKASQGISQRVSLVLLIQETARPRFNNFLDQLRTHTTYVRAYAITEPVIQLAPISVEEAREYIDKLLSRLLGEQRKLISEDVINDILGVVDKLGNTRLKVSLIRSILSMYISMYLAALGDPSIIQKLQQLKPRDIIAKGELAKILGNVRADHIESVSSKIKSINVGLPEKLRDVLSGDYAGIAKYADAISRATAEEIYKAYRDRGAMPVTLRSSAKGYKAYEVLIRPSKDTRWRLVIWARLARINVKKLGREKILRRLHITEDEIEKIPTKILFIHTPAVTGALVHEADPELIVPILLDPATLAVAVMSVDPRLTQGLPTEVVDSFRKAYEENYLRKVLNIVEQLIK